MHTTCAVDTLHPKSLMVISQFICSTTYTNLTDIQWLQASMPVRNGVQGIRRVSSLAPSAFLGSTVKTATNHNGDIHFKRTETATVETATVKTATNQNDDKPKQQQTITTTSILNEPKRRQSKRRKTETATSILNGFFKPVKTA